MKLKNKLEQGVASRVAAAQMLADIIQNHRTIDETLEKYAARYSLSDADKRLVHAISGFVFRNLSALDRIVAAVMNRKRPPSPLLLQQLLRVGVAQLIYMEVAEHAAIHATVSAAGALHLSRQKSLVNAILRSVQRQRSEWVSQQVHPLEKLPDWLVQRWVKNYGESLAAEFIGSMDRQAPIDITLKDPDASLEWAQKLDAEPIGIGSLRIQNDRDHIASWAGFAEGAWWVQDLSASLPINMLGDVSGKPVLDMCAAPGGKAMQLAARGADLTVIDKSGARMKRVIENLQRCGLDHGVKTVVMDALKWRPEHGYDAIIIDAPCSATGTLRRHPELPWNHEEKRILELTVTQCALLDHASKMLNSKGRIIYCTCSMEAEEGEDQVESFLSKNNNYREMINIPDLLKPLLKRGVRNIGWRTYPTTLSDRGGMDGFFMACLEKQ